MTTNSIPTPAFHLRSYGDVSEAELLKLATPAAAASTPAEIAWQHMDAVRQFLEDAARTNSKDRDNWAEDVAIAINMLVRPASALPAAQQPANGLDEFLALAKEAGVTHWTPEMTAAVAKRSEEIAAAQQPAERPAIAHIAEPTEAEFSGAMDQVASNLPRAAQQSLANGIQPGETVAQAAERWAQWCERRCLSMLPEFLRLLARAWESAVAAQQPAVEPVARVVVHKTGGNAGIAWSAVPVDDAPLMRDGDLLYASPTAQPAPDVVADARRYAWLRDHLWSQALAPKVYALPIVWGVDYPGEAGKSMDAAIDAELDREGPKT